LKLDKDGAKEIVAILASKNEYIDYDYQNSKAAAILPAAIERIEELERLLVESEAVSLHNFRRYMTVIGEGHISNMDHKIGWSDLPEEQRKAILEVHREMLRVGGKL
jgi:hypothetical protein